MYIAKSGHVHHEAGDCKHSACEHGDDEFVTCEQRDTSPPPAAAAAPCASPQCPQGRRSFDQYGLNVLLVRCVWCPFTEARCTDQHQAGRPTLDRRSMLRYNNKLTVCWPWPSETLVARRHTPSAPCATSLLYTCASVAGNVADVTYW